MYGHIETGKVFVAFGKDFEAFGKVCVKSCGFGGLLFFSGFDY